MSEKKVVSYFFHHTVTQGRQEGPALA